MIGFLFFISMGCCVWAESAKALVLTYPRSGTHWFMHCVEYLTADDLEKQGNCGNVASVHTMHSLEMLESYLGAAWQTSFDPDRDYLILLLRNYKESMLREFSDPKEVVQYIKNDHECLNFRFFQNLQNFDNWAEDRKLLIYYEELLKFPERELTRFINFLNLSNAGLPMLMDGFEEHKKKTIDIYNNKNMDIGFAGSVTEGKDLLYHSKKVSLRDLKEIEAAARTRAPALYDKYLKRFECDNSEDFKLN